MSNPENNLVISKAFYFFFFSAFMLRLTYTPVYFKQLGLSPSLVGVLSGAGPFARAFGGLALCYVADRANLRKTIFIISLLACVCVPFLFTFPKPKEQICPTKNPYDNNKANNSSILNNTSLKLAREEAIQEEARKGGFETRGHISLQESNETRRIKRLGPWHFKRTAKHLEELSANIPRKKDKNTLEKSHLQESFKTHRLKNTKQGINKHKHKHNNNNVSSNVGNNTQHDNHDHRNHTSDTRKVFIMLLAITVIGDFVGGPSRNLADTATMFYLGDTKSEYGMIRLWGNVGQLIIIPSVSILVYYTKTKICSVMQDDYQMSLYILSGAMVVALLIGLRFDFTSPEIKVQKQESKECSSVKDLVFPLRNSTVLVIALFLGIFEGLFQTFMFWFIVSLDQSQATLVIAIAVLLRNITAFVTFLGSPIILRKIGTFNALNLSLVLYAITFAIYSVIRNPWLALIPEIIQYVGFALSMSACVSYFGEIAPDDMAATAQGLLQFMYSGVGQGVGPIVGGIIMDNLGGHSTFLVFTGVAISVLIFSLIAQQVLKHSDNDTKYQPVLTREDSG